MSIDASRKALMVQAKGESEKTHHSWYFQRDLRCETVSRVMLRFLHSSYMTPAAVTKHKHHMNAGATHEQETGAPRPRTFDVSADGGGALV